MPFLQHADGIWLGTVTVVTTLLLTSLSCVIVRVPCVIVRVPWVLMHVIELLICVFNRAWSFDFFSECWPERTKMAEMCKGGRLTVRLKLKILDLYERNLSVLAIKDRLLKEDSVKFSRTTIYSFLKRSCWILTRRRRTVNPASVKLKELHLKFIDLWMDKNNELKASELQKRLFETFGLK